VKNILINLILVALISCSVFFGFKAYKNAKSYEQTTSKIVDMMSASDIAQTKLKSILEDWSFGLYENKDKQKLNQLNTQKAHYKQQAKTYTIYSILALAVVIITYFLIPIRIFVFWSALGALVMLIYGVISPIMMVTIHKQIEHFGDVILSLESKSVISSALKLYDKGDMVVAGVLLLFSVIIPLLKTLSMMFVSLFEYSSFAHSVIKFFKHLGKWSMVDVFVVSTFLVYLSTNSGDITRSEVEIGIYFFLAYVIVSMLVSLAADKMLHNVKSNI
jgi:hypothetical protein